MSGRVPELEPRRAYSLWAAGYPPHAHNAFMLAEERAMLACLPDQLQGLRVLDAGCGSGRYILHALRRGANDLVGLDTSAEMLARASTLPAALLRASVDCIPMVSGWADVTVCALTLGHLPNLAACLAELSRATNYGGLVLCSDFHPVADALGWQRTFTVAGVKYAVRHYAHSQIEWKAAARAAGLRVLRVAEPVIAPDDVPMGARYDTRALTVPAALVIAMEKEL